jgi:rubrerythrin
MRQELHQAIRQAMDREKESYSFYQRLSREAKGINLQRLCNMLSLEELKHEALLKECLRSGDLSRAKERMGSRHEDLSIEGKLVQAAENTGVIDGLGVAIRREQVSIGLYSRLLTLAESEDERQLFGFLVEEERGHAAEGRERIQEARERLIYST